MIQLTIERDATARAEALLKLIPGGIEKAAASAANRAADGMRTDAVRETTKKYFVGAKEVRETLSFRKATPGTLVAQLTSKGKRRSLAAYNLSPSRPRARRSETGKLRGAVKKEGGLKPLGPAFLIRGATGWYPFYRTGKGKRKVVNIGGGLRPISVGSVKSLTSPAIPQIIRNKETVKAIQEKGIARFEKRLEHEAWRILNGIGGKGGGRR